jgi:hypothetical protein
MAHSYLSKSTLYNIILIVISSAIFIVILEVVLIIIAYPHTAPSRYLMWSSPTFHVDSYGAVTFAQSTSIREVAIYNNHIEYDMFYITNNMGCVDSIDYQYDNERDIVKSRYAFVGDSFTAGSGGYDWVSVLRDKLISSGKNVMIYNFGIPGTGLQHFLKLLQSTARVLEFTDIAIIAISDDMRRHYWLPLSENGRVYFCAISENKESCLTNTHPIATIIDRDATQNETLNHVKQIEKQLETEHHHITKGPLGVLLRKSRLFRLIVQFMNVSYTGLGKNDIDLTSLEKIKLRFPQSRIHFIHLPQKEEVVQGRYHLELKISVESLGIHYYDALSKCSWSNDMFLEHDGHPNISGYTNISQCLQTYLLDSLSKL